MNNSQHVVASCRSNPEAEVQGQYGTLYAGLAYVIEYYYHESTLQKFDRF